MTGDFESFIFFFVWNWQYRITVANRVFIRPSDVGLNRHYSTSSIECATPDPV